MFHTINILLNHCSIKKAIPEIRLSNLFQNYGFKKKENISYAWSLVALV